MPLLTKGDNSHSTLHRFPNNVDEDVDANLYKTKFFFGGGGGGGQGWPTSFLHRPLVFKQDTSKVLLKTP